LPANFREAPLTTTDPWQPVSGDAFRSLCTHVFWSNTEPRENAAFRNSDVVFCKIDEVWRLFRALRRTRKRVVLVTGEGDKPVDAALWQSKPPHVAAWFGTNMQIVGDRRARGLPLGIGNSGGRKTPRWMDLHRTDGQVPQRANLLYANFSERSNPSVREPLLRWLAEPAQQWINRGFYDPESAKTAYVDALHAHRFVLCPPGNGEDTHRFWEALYCGAVPVVRRSEVVSHFTGLPFVAFDDLREVTPQALAGFPVGPKASEQKMLWLDHWREALAAARSDARAEAEVSLADWIAAWRAEVGRLLG